MNIQLTDMIFAGVLFIQSIFIYYLVLTLKNLITISKNNLSYTGGLTNEAPIDYLSLNCIFQRKPMLLKDLFSESSELTLIFLSESCSTCRAIYEKRSMLPSNIKFVFNEGFNGELDEHLILSDAAFKYFDVQMTPQILILETNNTIKMNEIIYSTDEFVQYVS